jgi:sirohydrochlorin ferrochelatase
VTPPLVAVAHGSGDPAAARATEALLEEVRRQRPGLDVRAAYLDHSEPRLEDVLRGAAGAAGLTDAVVVPLLLGAAYHSRVDIPAAVAASGARAVQADVLGPDPLLLDALERRLAAVGVAGDHGRGDHSTAVVLAAAGSTDSGAVDGVRALARHWAARGWWAVEAAFASAAGPTVPEAVAGLRARGAPRVAVASYLLYPGLFADAVAAAGADVPSAPLADAPEVAHLVLSRYDAAVAPIGA